MFAVNGARSQAKLVARQVLASQQVNNAAMARGGRTAVNLSALKGRIRATKNVAKITNVMKLVASSKLKSVEEALEKGRAFGESILNAIALPQIKVETEGKKDKDDEAIGLFNDDKKHLVVAITTDRGLCGAVNSSLARSLRRELAVALKDNRDVRMITFGDKGRAQLARDYAPLVATAVDQCFDKDPVFPLAASLAVKIIAQPYDILTLYYNHYENQAKFHNSYKRIPQLANLKPGQSPEKLKGYDLEPEGPEVLVNLQEYGIASALYYAMLETSACETSQRVMAMDNATENAKEMVHSLSLIYNRARQAKITTELTEIISGAESLNDGSGDD